MNKIYQLSHQEARQNAQRGVLEAPDGYFVIIKEPTRSTEQNAALWGILQAFSDQLEWPVNGQMVKLAAEDWKDLLSAAFKRETARLAQGIDGGVVMLGLRTSKMGKREFGDFLEFLHATAAARGVEVYADA